MIYFIENVCLFKIIFNYITILNIIHLKSLLNHIFFLSLQETLKVIRYEYFCEYIYTKPKVKAGVLKVTDENSPFFGKYIGANYTGIAIQRCVGK